jgi:hypothetical protein
MIDRHCVVAGRRAVEVVVAAFVLAALAACGGSETPKPVTLVRASPTTTPDWPTPWPGPPLAPGSFSSVNFQPPVQLRVDQLGWHVVEDSAVALTLLFDPDEDLVHDMKLVSFQARPERVVPDPFAFNDEGEGASEPAPADLLEWFEQRPQLKVTRLAPLTLSGSPAQRGRIEVEHLPADADYGGCFTRCVVAYLEPDGQPRALFERATYELILPSNTSAGSQAFVLIGAPVAEFDLFRAEADSILRTVVFR